MIKIFSKYNFGLFAETIAVIFLRCKGYKIIARRVGRPIGEIDIISTKNNTIIFVEVKARSIPTDDILVSKRQQQRISRSALLFIATHHKYQNYNIRFDIIAIEPWHVPRHFFNVWEV